MRTSIKALLSGTRSRTGGAAASSSTVSRPHASGRSAAPAPISHQRLHQLFANQSLEFTSNHKYVLQQDALKAHIALENGEKHSESSPITRKATRSNVAGAQASPRQQRRHAFWQKQQVQPEVDLAGILCKLEKLVASLPDPDTDPDAQRKQHEIQVRLQGVVLQLSASHYGQASSQQLIALLRMISLVGVTAGHVCGACIQELVQRAPTLAPRDVVQTLNFLLPRRDGMDQLCDALPLQLVHESVSKLCLDLLSRQSTGDIKATPHASIWSQVHPSSLCKLLDGTVEAIKRPGGNVKLLQQDLARDVLLSVIDCFLPAAAQASAAAASKGLMSLEYGHIVVLCRAIAEHHVPNEAALRFLAAAAPIIRELVLCFSARQLSELVAAYAQVGYRDATWFMMVAQRIGELGDKLREDDVAKVLRALDVVGVPHDTLRCSLESSLRMRQLRRKSLRL